MKNWYPAINGDCAGVRRLPPFDGKFLVIYQNSLTSYIYRYTFLLLIYSVRYPTSSPGGVITREEREANSRVGGTIITETEVDFSPSVSTRISPFPLSQRFH